MAKLDTPFAPDWVSPPGDTILDIIEERGWPQTELATRLGYSTKHTNQLIKGKVPLTEDAAVRLERVLGGSVGFWLAREAKYRERCVRLEAAQKEAEWISWLDELPVKQLMDAGAIPKQRVDRKSKPDVVEKCLRFFGVASPEEWRGHYAEMQCSFRRSRAEQSDVGAISSWLRMGEQHAEKLDARKYDRNQFIEVLTQIRQLTILPPEEFEPQLRNYFKQAGVSFVLVPAIPKARVSGVARWLNPHRPLIQLSLYGKTNDKFWFTLFHEAAHILLHSKEKKSVFLDDPNKVHADNPEEHEANTWAGDFLIPPEFKPYLPAIKSKAAACDLARQAGVHPGIVVGRLQHDGLIKPSWMNDLKDSFRFAEN